MSNSRTNTLSKQIYVINFDGIITPDHRFQFLESGPGLSRVGYHIDEAFPTNPKGREQIIATLFEFYEHVYIVSANPEVTAAKYQSVLHCIKLEDIPLQVIGVTPQFIENNKTKISAHTLDQFLAQKNSLVKNAIIIANVETFSTSLQPHELGALLRSKGITLPVANDLPLFRIFYPKPLMADIFAEQAPAAIPRQELIDIDNLGNLNEKLKTFTSRYVVLKPIDSTRSYGIVLIPNDRATEVLTWLANPNPTKMPTSNDPEFRKRLNQLAQEMDRTARMCILQEFLHAEEITVQGATFRPSVRIAVVACFDPNTSQMELRVPLAYYELPMTPISQQQTLLWSESICFQALHHLIEAQPDKVIAYSRRLEKVQFPSIVLMSDQLKGTIIPDILKTLIPVFAYLFKADELTYYASVFKRKNTSLYSFVSQMIPLMRAYKMDTVMCDFFEKENLNVVKILLYRLSHSIENLKCTKYFEMLSKELSRLLLHYQQNLGSRTKNELDDIKELASDYLVNYQSLLQKMEFGATLIARLEAYKKGEFSSANEIYEQGVAKFNVRSYAESSALFKTANQLCVPGSALQAMCFYSLASLSLQQEQYNEAVNFIENCLEIREKLIGEHLISEQELLNAKEQLRIAKELALADKNALSALTLFQKQQYQGAIEQFQEAIAKHSNIQDKSGRLAIYHYNLSSSYDRMSDVENALKHANICFAMRVAIYGSTHALTQKVAEKIKQLGDKNVEKPCNKMSGLGKVPRA